jgi:hypothetical protein
VFGFSVKTWPSLTTTSGVGEAFKSVTGSARLSAKVITPTAASVVTRGVVVPAGPPSGAATFVGC